MNRTIADIRKMNLITKEDGYELYEDDCTGELFEIDLDGDEVTRAYKLDEDFEILEVLI